MPFSAFNIGLLVLFFEVVVVVVVVTAPGGEPDEYEVRYVTPEAAYACVVTFC